MQSLCIAFPFKSKQMFDISLMQQTAEFEGVTQAVEHKKDRSGSSIELFIL